MVREGKSSGAAEAISTAPSPAASQVRVFLEKIIFKLAMRWDRTTCSDLFVVSELAELCFRAREALWSEPISPICIVGDLHGQYDDLLGMFDLNGWPFTMDEINAIRIDSEGAPKDFRSRVKRMSMKVVRYLFLGDYVDRGPFSIEVVTLLLALKLRWPDRIFLLRGNHESRPVNHHYGFYTEVKYRYGEELYELFQMVFNVLPFTAIISNKIMCMHGGISSLFVNMDQFLLLKRPIEIPDVGVLADLTWADPDPTVEEYATSPRGASFVFGKKALRKFLELHGLELIVRAHQVVEDGYEFFDDRRLVTIFSAPNYCGKANNTACILIIDENLAISLQLFRPESRELDRKKKAAAAVAPSAAPPAPAVKS
ncbi:unnamed protein product [Caenorhabditis auriculariae]|uniref:Serine/threonine-protein phosphatase n=1 Tax=Caenorhabditis auriculariae TaxID=2777116 RepID=A0A8S1HE49_9PELO|nr:unnamed protein product [Caenorhabditis auriculariae]